MGLSIHVITDKDVYSNEYYQNEKEYRSKMRLSSDFAELMARVNVTLGLAELKQVEAITNVDLTPLWDMAMYHDEEHDVPNNNIKYAINTVNCLIEKLNDIDSLHTKIEPYDYDIDFEYYFADFSKDKANDSSDNNFGQDLRNLKRFLDYALSKGAMKVWFRIE